jgi:hypothetical protein
MRIGLFAIIFTLLFLSVDTTAADDQICQRETLPRPGHIPRQCDYDQEKRALTCYDKCRTGYSAVLARCRADCPDGYTTGILNYCNKSENYRVAGFGWKAGDGLGSNKLIPARGRCEAKHGAGGCVLRQSAYYPRCRSGFFQTGINICAQSCPTGWEESDNRCLRPSYARTSTKPQCEKGEIFVAGFCRDECPQGYSGDRRCSAACPSAFPVSCGILHCGRSSEACRQGIATNIIGPFAVALNNDPDIPGTMALPLELQKELLNPLAPPCSAP